MTRVQKRTTLRSRHRRGLTLIEVMIGTLISIFLTAAAVVFASHETKLLGFSTEEIEMQQSARSALDLLARDIEMAGAGFGYQTAPGGPFFVGLQTHNFRALDDGLQFNNAGFANQPQSFTVAGLRESQSSGATYSFPTHDLGILMADGERMTIVQAAAVPAGSGFICDPTNLLDPAETYLVAFRTSDLLLGGTRTMRVLGNAGPGNCPAGYGLCGTAGDGCRSMQFAMDTLGVANNTAFDSGDTGTVDYSQGELAVGFKQVIWWVARETLAMDSHRANLRRVEIDSAATTCPIGSRATCGGEVAYNVETLQYQVWAFNSAGGPGVDPSGFLDDDRWVAIPANTYPIGPGPGRNPLFPKLRVDVELVIRSRVPDEKPHVGARVTLAAPNAGAPGLCLPGGTAMPGAGECPGDRVKRRVHRISVEVKNSGPPT
jgi:hypothetical protein